MNLLLYIIIQMKVGCYKYNKQLFLAFNPNQTKIHLYNQVTFFKVQCCNRKQKRNLCYLVLVILTLTYLCKCSLHLPLLYTHVQSYNTWARLLICLKTLLPFPTVSINLYLVSLIEITNLPLGCVCYLASSVVLQNLCFGRCLLLLPWHLLQGVKLSFQLPFRL